MKYKIGAHIEITNVENDGVVVCFDVESGETHILDEAAAAVLETVGKGMSIHEASEKIAKDFNAELLAVKKDVVVFVEELLVKRIIVEDK